jgi:hypothetical protein
LSADIEGLFYANCSKNNYHSEPHRPYANADPQAKLKDKSRNLIAAIQSVPAKQVPMNADLNIFFMEQTYKA